MIFVTTGTNEQGFDRLVRAAGALPAGEELLVQFGSSRAPHGGHGRWVDFLGWDEMEAAMSSARVVVAHAGVGSILMALRCGKRPIVMARRVALGEAVDDHQIALAQRLASDGRVRVVEDAAELALAVAEVALPEPFEDGAGASPLAAELRATLFALTGREAI
ncbi:MAG: hypothetical protein QOJ82_3517 [Solirubrobacteraceae bacterium]|jgi:UDP-N-acetylglucosamine transferase subunit ALG13|nr:hypothetical protein [Solirubrobacteraceae bacterium]